MSWHNAVFRWRLLIGLGCIAFAASLLYPLGDPYERPAPPPGASAGPYAARMRLWADETVQIQIQRCTLRVTSRYEEVCAAPDQARQRSITYGLAEIDPEGVSARSTPERGAVLIDFREPPQVGWLEMVLAGYRSPPRRLPFASVYTEYCEAQSVGGGGAPVPLPPGEADEAFPFQLGQRSLPFRIETGPEIREIAVPADRAERLASVLTEAARACAPE